MIIIAQTTQEAVTTESTNWLGAFPLGIAIYAALGAFLAVAVIFRKRLDNANSSTTPASNGGVWLLILTTFVIGWIVGFVGTPILAEYQSIQSQPAVNGLACAMALLGVPASYAAIAVGEGLISRWAAKPPEPPK